MRKSFATILMILIASAVVFSSDLKVSWTHTGTPSDTTGFVVSYGPSSRNYTNSLRTGYTDSAIISNLPPNALIFITAAATDSNGFEGDWGNEVFTTTTSDTNQLPSAVRDFRLMR